MTDHSDDGPPADGDVDPHRLVGALALDAIDDAERALVEQHLAACEACRDELVGFTETAAALGGAVAAAPPDRLRAAVLASVATTRQDPPTLAARRATVGRAPNRRLVVALAAALVALAAMAVVIVRLLDEVDDLGRVEEIATAADAETVVLAGDVPGTVRVTWSEEEAALLVVADGLPAVPEGRTYQLWLIGPAGPSPSVTFRPDADGAVEVVAEGPVGDAQVVGITEEPAGGSPAPTGDVLAGAELTA